MSTNSIVYSPINYKLELKRLIVNEFLRYFQTLAAGATDPVEAATMANIKCTLEYPLTAEGYPAIIVGYKEKTVHNAGISHVEDDGNLSIERWIFEGDVQIEVFALTSLERDYVSDNLVNLFAFGAFLGAVFEPNIDTETAFYDVQANMKVLGTIQEDVMSGAAWGLTDSRIYHCGYTFPILGAFTSNSLYEEYISKLGLQLNDNFNAQININLGG